MDVAKRKNTKIIVLYICIYIYAYYKQSFGNRSDFKFLLTYKPDFRAHVLKLLKEEHPDFPLQYNISLVHLLEGCAVVEPKPDSILWNR